MHYQVVFIIHGVGGQVSGYSTPFQGDVQQHIGSMSSATSDDVRIIYKEIHWSEITQDIQDELDARFATEDNLGQSALRGIMLNLIGDALAYQDSKRGRDVYRAVHQAIDDARAQVQDQVGTSVEYTFVSHSLGSVIASDYCYNHRNDIKVTNFFTMGSPIALWTMRAGHPDNADCPIQVERPNGVWVNIFDDDDVIGWPLKKVNAHYDAAFDFDYATRIGGLVSAATPLSHRGYWTDGNAHKPIAKKLALDQERLVNDVAYDKDAYIAYIESLWNI